MSINVYERVHDYTGKYLSVKVAGILMPYLSVAAITRRCYTSVKVIELKDADSRIKEDYDNLLRTLTA